MYHDHDPQLVHQFKIAYWLDIEYNFQSKFKIQILGLECRKHFASL